MNGIVLIFVDEQGNAIANAVDFNKTGYGGYTLLESQRVRARSQLSMAVVSAYSSPQLTRGVDRMAADSIVNNLVAKHGCKISEVVVGHTSKGGQA